MNARHGMFHYTIDIESAVGYRKSAFRCAAKGVDHLKRVNIDSAKHWLEVARLTRINIRTNRNPK